MSVDTLPSSEACERNKAPILAILSEALAASRRVLEVGSGTGQHAVHFSRNLPHLQWQPTERQEALPALRQRIQQEGPVNLCAPIELDVGAGAWPPQKADAIFTANTLHIMDWAAAQALFQGIGGCLAAGGLLCVYGPFRYRGRYTSDSNAAFDRFLQDRDPASGIRDFVAIDALAAARGLELLADNAMPANNQLLLWRRTGGSQERIPY